MRWRDVPETNFGNIETSREKQGFAMSKKEKLSAFLAAFAYWHTSDAPFRAVVTAWEEYLAAPDDSQPTI